MLIDPALSYAHNVALVKYHRAMFVPGGVHSQPPTMMYRPPPSQQQHHGPRPMPVVGIAAPVHLPPQAAMHHRLHELHHPAATGVMCPRTIPQPNHRHYSHEYLDSDSEKGQLFIRYTSWNCHLYIIRRIIVSLI